MKYEQPYGVTDPNAPYINGNPAAGIQGSIPPAAAFEFPMRELVAMIAGGGLTPSDSDLQQLLQAVRSQMVNYCVDGGTLPNNYVTSFSPPITTYFNGMVFRLLLKNTNTGVSSFDAGGGRHAIKKMGGADPAAGDLPGGSIVELLWNPAGPWFEMTNFTGQATSGSSPPPVTVPGLVNIQIFTFSQIYTPTTGASKAFIIATAGGGSGGNSCPGGGGAGAGETRFGLQSLAGVTTIPVTIGAGGASIAASNTNGLVGGNTTWGSLITCMGGAGGYANGYSGLGGGPGIGGILGIQGGDGHPYWGYNSSGHGGGSFWGGGGAGTAAGMPPVIEPGRAFGAGGGGSLNPSMPSGQGAPGVVMVMEF